MSQDIFTRLNDLDQDTIGMLASILERRGRHPQQVAIRQAYLDALGDIDGLDVLEVGCGTGVVSRDLAQRIGVRGHLTATDPTPALIDTARQLADGPGSASIQYEIQDARTLQYPDARFDLTCAVTVLSHTPDREQILGEMARVTRPGGRLLIVDADFASNQIEHPDEALTGRLLEAWRAVTVDDSRVMRRIGQMLAAAGLTVRSVAGHVHVEAGKVDPEASFILAWTEFAARQAVTAGAVSDTEADGWVADIRALHERHLLFGSVTYISVICERP